MIKPNHITVFRLIGSAVLLFTRPFSVLFYTVYTLCGVSDMLDGWTARRTGTISRKGAVLDSIADLAFFLSALWVLIPCLSWERWMLWWIAGIAAVRFAALEIGLIKYRRLSFLHTYSNKAVGFLLFCFPFLCSFLNFERTAGILCAAASLAALEELCITLLSDKPNQDIAGILQRQKPCGLKKKRG